VIAPTLYAELLRTLEGERADWMATLRLNDDAWILVARTEGDTSSAADVCLYFSALGTTAEILYPSDGPYAVCPPGWTVEHWEILMMARSSLVTRSAEYQGRVRISEVSRHLRPT
jgi:hypothetical protein